MSNLTVGKQQMCEIAKAVSFDAKVIIFDEPSAALTESEIEEMFKIIRDLKKKDIAMVYISHRMDEIKVITDRVTVMRDGTYVGTLITEECTKEDIINMMVGRVIYEDPKTESAVPKDAPVVLKVEHLNAGRMVQDVSFELRKGEDVPRRREPCLERTRRKAETSISTDRRLPSTIRRTRLTAGSDICPKTESGMVSLYRRPLRKIQRWLP